jgi:hypothetical protein
MATVKKLAALYMMGVGVAVGVYFVVNPLFAEFFGSASSASVWVAVNVLNALVGIGLASALIFNFARKQAEWGRDSNGAVTRRYLEVNAAFYLTAGVTILFLHNWLSLLAFGRVGLDSYSLSLFIWPVGDVVLPLIMGVTGYRLWREASQS